MGKTGGMDDLILVRGTASTTCPADRGILTITARVKQSTPADAERALAEQTTAVDSVLDRFAAIIATRMSEHLSIRPNTYWHPETGRNVVDGHIGERGVRVTISDPAQAGTLVRALYDAAGVEVGGPDWELAEDNPVHGKIRRAAARDAKNRADQYADGLGLSVGSVASVTEPGLNPEPRPMGRAMAMHSMAADAEMSAAPTVDLGSAEIRVSTSIDVGFRIEPGR